MGVRSAARESGCWLRTLLLASFATVAAGQPRPLAIVRPALHQFDGGPALPASHEFLSGEYVFLTFQIEGYKATEKEHVALTYEIDAFDQAGVKYVETKKGGIGVELAQEDKDWKPVVRHDFLIPPLALTSRGRIEIRVRDNVGGASVTRSIELKVRGPNLETGAALAAQRFRFLRTEEDGPGISPPAYRPGDTLWARFEITGYKLGEANRFHVSYGLEVLRAGGDSLYKEPKAAEQEETAFYPKLYVPGILSLNLTKDLTPGEYSIVLSVRDELGKQDLKQVHKFAVE